MPKIRQDMGFSLDDLLIVPQHSDLKSRSECDTTIQIGSLKLGVPVFSAAMDSLGSTEFAHSLVDAGGCPIIHRFNSITDQANLVAQISEVLHYDGTGRVAAAIGIHDTAERAAALVGAGVGALIFDVAHADTLPALLAIAETRKAYPDLTIIAGTVGTPEACERLINLGVQGVRVGIGTGAACITRTVAGVGVPQASALLSCAEVCNSAGVALLSDGGLRTGGDFAKSIGLGATACVAGYIFASTVESGTNGTYFGMATRKAGKKVGKSTQAEEGTTVKVEVNTTVQEVVNNLQGGLRSAMSYSASRTIPEFQKNVEFMMISPASQREGNRGI